MDPSDQRDLRRERALSRFEERARGGSDAERALAEKTARDVRPAIDAAAFVAELGADDGGLALHEASAMWNLLGRLVAAHASTATAALSYLQSLVAALESEGIAPRPEARDALSAVFVEGFVLAREDRARAEVEREVLATLRARRVTGGVDLLTLTGPYEPRALASALEDWVRAAFKAGVRAAVIDLLSASGAEAHARALRETILVLASLGVDVVVVGAPAQLELPPDCRIAASFEEALSRALSAREISDLVRGRLRRLFRRA